MASGSSNGSVHVWRVEYVTRSGNMPDKYTGLQCKPLCQVAPSHLCSNSAFSAYPLLSSKNNNA